MWIVAATLMLSLGAGAVQSLGFLGTCTQNDTGPFLVGTVLSLPMLALAIAGALHVRTRQRRGTWIGRAEAALCFGPIALLSFTWLVLNRAVWVEALVRLGSPCGPDYFERGSRIEPEQIFIGIVYGPMHLILALLAAMVALSEARSLLRHERTD